MIDWIIRNIVSVMIVMVIAFFAVLAVIRLVKDHKKGKTCSCGCENCVYSSGCNGSRKRSPGKTN